MEFRRLRANEIDVRVGHAKKDGAGFSLLLYKDARCDMNILDETVGALNWQRSHECINGGLYCKVSIYNEANNQWISKSDIGTKSNTEAEKGEASDSFKRACTNWGIGRELYTAPFIWVPATIASKFDKFKVEKIEYDDYGNIESLIIVNAKDQSPIYPLPKGVYSSTKDKQPNTASQAQSTKSVDGQGGVCSECGTSINAPVMTLSTNKFGKPLCRECQKKQQTA